LALIGPRNYIVKPVTDKENSGKESTREIIVRALKAHNQASVGELATAADVSPVTVRHHLNALLAEGLLITKSVRRKVGRPHIVYSLSQKGHDLFPQKYARLSSRLLDELKVRLPAEAVAELFVGAGQRTLDKHKEEFEDLPFEDRLDYLVELLAEEGFLASWEKIGGAYRLTEYSCPYISVGQHHAEICSFDTELILNVLRTDVTQHSCMLSGHSCCEFSFEAAEKEQ
jgi:DeoR family transcriptional regulator, suf operon transcriptional repressor